MMNPVPWLQMTNMISYQGLVRTFPSHQEHKNLIILFSKLEQRLLTNTFEICAATVGLSDIERKAAARQVNIALGKEVIQ